MAESELAALFAVLGRRAMDLETPVLQLHELEMWDYVVLSRLVDGPAQTQAKLAAASGRDQTRLIPILDRLEGRDLVRRTPDPADRRNRIVTLTDAGRRLAASVHADIVAVEENWLAALSATDRAALRRILPRLAEQPFD